MALEQDAIVFQQEIARLQALLEASRQVHGGLALHDVLLCALEIAVKELELDGALFTAGPALGGQEPESGAQVSYGQVPEEFAALPRVGLRDRQGQLLTELVAFRSGLPLSFEEQDFLEGLALQTAVAVENASHHERTIAWERLQRDLTAARAIQRSLLPQETPDIPGYGLGFRSHTCYEVGGDYLDILQVGERQYVIVVADVAGKGLASAMVSVSFRAAFRAMATAGMALDELAARMNDLHFGEGSEARRRYVTAILMRLDAGRHEIEIVNAGHNPGFLVDAAGKGVLLEASGPPLGMLPARTYTIERHALAPGGRLLFYTDGLTEVFQGDDEFGMDRLLDTFTALHEPECETMLDGIWRELDAFADKSEQSDDMTALVLVREKGNLIQMKEPAITTELRLPSRLGFEKVAMQTAAGVAQMMGFSESRVEDLKTAVAEACINAIEHGNMLDTSKTVIVILAMEHDTLEVKVVDRGSGVDQASIKAPDIDRKMHGDEDPRGMGMFLIQALVDEAEWVTGAPEGSYARLAIHLDRGAEEGAN